MGSTPTRLIAANFKPGDPNEGDMYYDAERAVFKVFVNGKWEPTGFTDEALKAIESLETAKEKGELERTDVLELRMKGE